MSTMGSVREQVGRRRAGGVVRRSMRLATALVLVLTTAAVAVGAGGSGGGRAVAADGVRWPVGVAGRRVVDQFGVPFPLKIMSAWGMAQRLSNPEITAALEGLRAQGFNAVNVAGVGGVNVQADWTPGQYKNRAGAGFFSGAAFQSPLGPGMATVDWIQSEAQRLGMV